MKICKSCFQPVDFCNKKCFPISHPTISVSIDTNTPFSVILGVLQRSGIKIKQASFTVMPTMGGFETPQNQEKEAKVEEIKPNIYPVRGDEDSSDSSEEEESDSDFDDPDDEHKPNFKFSEKKKGKNNS